MPFEPLLNMLLTKESVRLRKEAWADLEDLQSWVLPYTKEVSQSISNSECE